MKRAKKLTLSLIVLGMSASVFGMAQAQVDHNPTKTITCKGTPSETTCTGFNKLYLQYVDGSSTKGGVFHFESGEAQPDADNQLIVYTYKSADGTAEIQLEKAYGGIRIDAKNKNWVEKMPHVYQCLNSQAQCPFTNTPMLYIAPPTNTWLL